MKLFLEQAYFGQQFADVVDASAVHSIVMLTHEYRIFQRERLSISKTALHKLYQLHFRTKLNSNNKTGSARTSSR